jgi:hypothetical protein
VIADLLPGHVERARHVRCGLRLGREHLEDARPERSEQDGGVGHARTLVPADYLVKENYFVGTRRNDPDSDDDGLSDGFEISVGTNPLDADSDDDGLPDGSDTDSIETAVTALPATAFAHPNNRTMILDHLASAEKQAQKGNINAARAKLESLRQHIDGCGAASNPNDWIVDCAAQVQIRAYVDILLANL